MDIDNEKIKIKFSHKLELQKIIIDKLLIGIIIILLGFVVNVIFENYRLKLAQDNFIMNKKFEAINSLRNAFNNMHSTFMEWTLTDNTIGHIPDDYKTKCNKIIGEYINAANKNSFLFSTKFTEICNYLLWTYQGFYYLDIKNCKNYREFAMDLNNAFEYECRKEIGIKNQNETQQYSLLSVTWQEAESMGGEGYLVKNFENWKLWKKKQSVKNNIK